jgi:peptide/nickel transport system permease protein
MARGGLRYLAARAAHAVVVLLGISLIVFVLVHLTGDPTAAMLPPDAPAETREAFRRQAGLDQPLQVQYVLFIARAARGDFGNSLREPVSAMSLVLERLPNTLQLVAAGLLIALVLGVLFGAIAAVSHRSGVRAMAETAGLVGQMVPDFWLGIMLILVFAVGLQWLPASGRGGPQFLLLPALTLAAYPLAMIMRLTRSSLREVLYQDYIRTAYSKGLSQRAVLARHALKNAAIPVVSYLGVQAAHLVGGAIVVETVFSYPGMGLLAVQSIATRDLPVIQAFVVVVGLFVILMNLLVDGAYAVLNPRLRQA